MGRALQCNTWLLIICIASPHGTTQTVNLVKDAKRWQSISGGGLLRHQGHSSSFKLGLMLNWPGLHAIDGPGSILFLTKLALMPNLLPWWKRMGYWGWCESFGPQDHHHAWSGGPLSSTEGHLLRGLGSCTSSHHTRGSDQVSKVLGMVKWEQRMQRALQSDGAKPWLLYPWCGCAVDNF